MHGELYVQSGSGRWPNSAPGTKEQHHPTQNRGRIGPRRRYPVLFLTARQHHEIVRRLLDFGKDHADRIPFHPAGMEYTSLMNCFLLHNLSAAETLLRISGSFGATWFPVTVGYTIVRTMFEADVTAHYVSQAPADRARQYIDFGAVLNKRQMDACLEHRNSKDPQWRESMSLLWQHHWEPRRPDISKKFDAVAPQFTRKVRDGKTMVWRNWSGVSLRQMAIAVDHVEAYDIFYSELSSFTHVDVHLADRFLQRRPDGPVWSQRAEEGDVGNVFRYAASFLTCYLELFGRQFKTWPEAAVQGCWKTEAN